MVGYSDVTTHVHGMSYVSSPNPYPRMESRTSPIPFATGATTWPAGSNVANKNRLRPRAKMRR